MKNSYIILILFIVTPMQGESQDVTEETPLPKVYDYKLLIEVPMYECTIRGKRTDSILMVAEPGSIFTIVNTTSEDSLIIRFWEWKENKALNFRLCFADTLRSKRKYFIVSRTDIADKIIKRYSRNPGFTAGSILIPFKLRLQHFDFSKDITLGPAAGVRFRLSHFSPDYVNILIGMGITSVTIDSRSTDSTESESSDAPALTPSIGFVFELNNVLQAGMFCGWDYIAHNDQTHFIYHGKTWLSFGLGCSLVTFNEDNPNTNKEKR